VADGAVPAGTSRSSGTGLLVKDEVSAEFWACCSALRLNCHGASTA
jgi:hypothetical protein